MKKNNLLNTPRVRFNWGFWDGRSDAQAKRRAIWNEGGKKHFDSIYEVGYWAGREQGSDPQSSEPAWRKHQQDKEGR